MINYLYIIENQEKQLKSLEILLDGKIDKRALDDLERKIFAIMEQ